MINIPEYPEVKSVFYFFEEISKIPHGSSNTKPIADYLVRFAAERGLEFYRDEADNVIIKKGATAGYESRPAVIIQGHTDMVAEKAPDCDKNMETEGLDLYRDGDFLRARGTTLGGDDGIAVAYALAILDASDIPHPPIEALFTSDEEIGLLGAAALDTSRLDGKIMINVDSDEEGIFTVGCAGGGRIDIKIPIEREACDGKRYTLKVGGLAGGHSGIEIGRGRENAIKIGAELLSKVFGARLITLTSGNMDNAIPREFAAEFSAIDFDENRFSEVADEVLAKYKKNEPSVYAVVEASESKDTPLTEDSSKKILSAISKTPSGVIKMSEDIEGLVESSQNLGIARLLSDSFDFTVSVRSAVGESKRGLIENMRSIAKEFGASISVRGEYPAWEYKKDSPLRDICCRVYRESYGKEPEVITIHAGLECGIFSDKIDGLDCISIGPDNHDIHTTEEHLSISSSARVFDFIKKVLKEI